jgi:AAA+ superfamily predicted ATPase
MALLEHLKRADKKVVMIMTLNSSDFIDDSCTDRIEIKIEFNLPSEENKLSFLKENFSKYANMNELKYITKNSIGYNYRDLPQLIKIAYREGDRSINMEGIKKAINLYNPSGLKRWNVKREIKTRFKHVIGQDNVKKELGKLMIYLKQNKKLSDLGIKQSNLIIFSGDSGVGKTYIATALAGELNLPLVKINAVDIHGTNPLSNISSIMHMAKRFRNSVIFIEKGKLNLNIDEDFFARVTENMNYRQMQRIWNDCVFYYLQNNTMDKNIFIEFISETKLNANRSNMFG